MSCSLVIPNFDLGIHSNVLFPESSNDWHALGEVHSDTNSTIDPLKHLIFRRLPRSRGTNH
jgi:hypothetical protein